MSSCLCRIRVARHGHGSCPPEGDEELLDRLRDFVDQGGVVLAFLEAGLADPVRGTPLVAVVDDVRELALHLRGGDELAPDDLDDDPGEQRDTRADDA